MGIRKCSHCGNNGHNSRTCNNPRSTVVMGGGGAGEGVRLFGVQLYIASPPMMVLKKSFSMDCLSSTASCTNYAASAISPSSSSSSSSLACIDEATEKAASSTGYLSDGLMARAQDQIRKKGVPWTEEEHKSFLAGLEKLGKGDWRGISRNFVATRTPTQVASHAQKYFLRLSSLNKNKIKRRSSLFDIGSGERAVLHATHEEVPSSHSLDYVKGVCDGIAIDLNSSFSSQYVDS